ncbi:MAG: hypothetical protein ACXAC7_21240 [Candidatus Hodarchaeales archaeon]|jgi:hypothetical protein
MSYEARVLYKNLNEDRYVDYGSATCHMRVRDCSEFFGVNLRSGINLELVEKYLNLLKTIGIRARIEEDFKMCTNFLYFDIQETEENLTLSRKGRLFCWQLIRLSLNQKKFVQKVLEMKEKFPSMDAWDCIWLAWDTSEEKDYPLWIDYYDSFYKEIKFTYISFENVLNCIAKNDKISGTMYMGDSEVINVDIDAIKNQPIKDQFRIGLELNIEMITIQSYNFIVSLSKYEGICKCYINSNSKKSVVILHDGTNVLPITMLTKDAIKLSKVLREHWNGESRDENTTEKCHEILKKYIVNE